MICYKELPVRFFYNKSMVIDTFDLNFLSFIFINISLCLWVPLWNLFLWLKISSAGDPYVLQPSQIGAEPAGKIINTEFSFNQIIQREPFNPLWIVIFLLLWPVHVKFRIGKKFHHRALLLFILPADSPADPGLLVSIIACFPNARKCVYAIALYPCKILALGLCICTIFALTFSHFPVIVKSVRRSCLCICTI